MRTIILLLTLFACSDSHRPESKRPCDGLEGFALYEYFYNTNHYFYDIVISDISMPNMDGVELIKNIKNINENQPVVMISAHTESKMLLDFIKLGIKDFLVKPISQSALYECFYNVSKKAKNQPEIKEVGYKNTLVDDILLDEEEFDIDIYK